MAWVCSASVQDSSESTTLEATCRLTPTPAAAREQTMTCTSGSLTKAWIAFSRAFGVWSPRMEACLRPRRVKVSSAMSMTSTWRAKKTTLPTLRASWAA